MTGRRPPVIFGDLALVPLSGGQVAIIDAVDLPLVAGSWRPIRSGSGNTTYARGGVGSQKMMHRVVLGMAPDDRREVDHRDGNGLNNRRSTARAYDAAAAEIHGEFHHPNLSEAA